MYISYRASVKDAIIDQSLYNRVNNMREKLSSRISALGKISFQPNNKQMKTLETFCRISLAKHGKQATTRECLPTPPGATRHKVRVGLGDYIARWAGNTSL